MNLESSSRSAGKSGRVIISAEELAATSNSEVVMFNPVGQLSETSLCFFIIYRCISDNNFTPIYKSEIKRPEGGCIRWNQV